jgi:hypothetical protein
VARARHVPHPCASREEAAPTRVDSILPRRPVEVNGRDGGAGGGQARPAAVADRSQARLLQLPGSAAAAALASAAARASAPALASALARASAIVLEAAARTAAVCGIARLRFRGSFAGPIARRAGSSEGGPASTPGSRASRGFRLRAERPDPLLNAGGRECKRVRPAYLRPLRSRATASVCPIRIMVRCVSWTSCSQVTRMTVIPAAVRSASRARSLCWLRHDR